MIVPNSNPFENTPLSFITRASDLLIALPIVFFLIINWLVRRGPSRHETYGPISHVDDPLLAVTTLAKGHALDIAMLTASPDGVVVSVGLDRNIKIWDLRQETRTHFIRSCNNGVSPFPVLATAIDEQAEWVALLCSSGLIMLWNINDRVWGPSDMVDIKDRTPLSFFFRPSKADKNETGNPAPLVLIRTSGLLTEIDFIVGGQNKMIHLQLCKSPLVCTVQFIDKFAMPEKPALRIVTASRRGCVHVASQLNNTQYTPDGHEDPAYIPGAPYRWVSDDVPLFAPDDDREVRSVLPLPSIGLFLAIRENGVDLVHVKTHSILHTFENLDLVPGTLQCFHSVKRKPHCGTDGLASFSIAYSQRHPNEEGKEMGGGDLILRTYIPKQEGDLICIGPKKCTSDSTCNSWTEARLHVYKVRNPGVWESLPSGAVVGVRKRRDQETSSISVVSALRRRGGSALNSATEPGKKETRDLDIWEAWMISATGERHVIPLHHPSTSSSLSCPNHNDIPLMDQHQLFVTKCGPMTRIGRRSIALGFGNVIKVITVGHEWFDTADDTSEDVSMKLARRSRKHKAGEKHHIATPTTYSMARGGVVAGSCAMSGGCGTGTSTPIPREPPRKSSLYGSLSGSATPRLATPTLFTAGHGFVTLPKDSLHTMLKAGNGLPISRPMSKGGGCCS